MDRYYRREEERRKRERLDEINLESQLEEAEMVKTAYKLYRIAEEIHQRPFDRITQIKFKRAHIAAENLLRPLDELGCWLLRFIWLMSLTIDDLGDDRLQRLEAKRRQEYVEEARKKSGYKLPNEKA